MASNFRKNLASILFWSIISAAFIGPGTVTTASKAGAGFGFSLLWALLFSIVGTVILQEAAARLAIISGKNVGELLSGGRSTRINVWIVTLAIFFGCAAYQAGNILGAVSGLLLVTNLSKSILVILVFILGFLLLFSSNYKLITGVLGVVVAIMGFAFIAVALKSDIPVDKFVSGMFSPSIPLGSELLVIGLIGTTIVPYNIFLGNGISHGQELNRMRTGLSIAVVIGGLISIAIMIVGTKVEGPFSFEQIKTTMEASGGRLMGILFGIGLFAAGISSSITSPLAAAVTAQSCFDQKDGKWDLNALNFRLIWGAVMVIGLLIGLLNLKVIPVIITAQAVNGLLLPIVASYLILLVNNPVIMGSHKNGFLLNLVSLIVIGVCFFIGLNNIFSVLSRWSVLDFLKDDTWIKLSLSLIGMIMMTLLIFSRRRR